MVLTASLLRDTRKINLTHVIHCATLTVYQLTKGDTKMKLSSYVQFVEKLFISFGQELRGIYEDTEGMHVMTEKGRSYLILNPRAKSVTRNKVAIERNVRTIVQLDHIIDNAHKQRG